MHISLKITDDKKAKTLFSFLKTLDFVKVEEAEFPSIPIWQQKIVLERLSKYKKNPSNTMSWKAFEKELDSLFPRPHFS